MTIDQYKRMFEFSGLKGPGQTVKVHGGRHHGLKSTVKDINWSEGEVLLTTKKDIDRWFSLAMVEVLDPIRPSSTPLPTRAPQNPVSRLRTDVPSPGRIDPPATRTEPRTTPSWIPKPKNF